MKSRHLNTNLILLVIMAWMSLMQQQAQANDGNEPVVVLKHDRTLIYPQRMQLNGNETLLDIIQMYRGMLVTGYNNMLDGYQLRMDDNNMFGDVRTLLTNIRAENVEKVQIVDNPGVQKGTTGLGGVIDISLKKCIGTYGLVGIEGADNGPAAIAGDGASNLLPSAMVRYSSAKTDVTGFVDYGHGSSNGVTKNKETVYLNISSELIGRDNQILTLSQQYGESDAPLQTTRNRTICGSFVNIHKFNDKGLKMVTCLIYIHNNSPLYTNVPQLNRNVGMTSKVNTPIGVAELYVPMPMKGMDLMLGYEFDYDKLDYRVDTGGELPEGSPAIPTDGMFSVTNHNIYAELTYEIPHWTFSLGGRSIFFRYHSDDHLQPAKHHNDERNIWRMSAIYRPKGAHQLQLSYNRKFVNPIYAEYNMANIVGQGEYMTSLEIDDEKFNETKIDQVQLNYYTTLGKVMLQSGATYYNLRGFVKTANVPVQWVQTDTWQAMASAFLRGRCYSLCAGMELTTSNYKVHELGKRNRSTYAVFNLAPTLYLPCDWQLRAKAVFFTKNAPARIAEDNDVYASLQLNKQIGSHIDLYAQWHDIFYGTHSYLMGGVKVRF